jgi:hypothetical protein
MISRRVRARSCRINDKCRPTLGWCIARVRALLLSVQSEETSPNAENRPVFMWITPCRRFRGTSKFIFTFALSVAPRYIFTQTELPACVVSPWGVLQTRTSRRPHSPCGKRAYIPGWGYRRMSNAIRKASMPTWSIRCCATRRTTNPLPEVSDIQLVTLPASKSSSTCPRCSSSRVP